MCTKHPHSLDELKQNIQNCILNVMSETVIYVFLLLCLCILIGAHDSAVG